MSTDKLLGALSGVAKEYNSFLSEMPQWIERNFIPRLQGELETREGRMGVCHNLTYALVSKIQDNTWVEHSISGVDSRAEIIDRIQTLLKAPEQFMSIVSESEQDDPSYRLLKNAMRELRTWYRVALWQHTDYLCALLSNLQTPGAEWSSPKAGAGVSAEDHFRTVCVGIPSLGRSLLSVWKNQEGDDPHHRASEFISICRSALSILAKKEVFSSLYQEVKSIQNQTIQFIVSKYQESPWALFTKMDELSKARNTGEQLMSEEAIASWDKGTGELRLKLNSWVVA